MCINSMICHLSECITIQCLLLPSEVVPEDIISIKGQQVEMASKQSTAPLQESNKQWIDVKQEESVMFLDSWEVNETEKENKVCITYYSVEVYCFYLNILCSRFTDISSIA